MRIGIDLGGTKIEAVVLDCHGRALHGERVRTPRGCYDAILDAVVALVARCESAVGRRCTVGVGIPGAISPHSARVKNANTTELIGRALDADLEHALGRPVRLANDANCFAMSEATDGAGQGAAVVFGVILGTGVGGGIVVGGRLLTGANAIAGEWGHLALPSVRAEELPGPACYCGRHGCVETWLSGPGLCADHLRSHGVDLAPPALVAAAARGDPRCEDTLSRYEDRLARALAAVINVLDPEVIVLGGGLSSVSRLYENVPSLWQAHVFSDHVATRLLPPRHGDASGVRGAAWLWEAGD